MRIRLTYYSNDILSILFSLFVFVLLVDPTNTIIKIKDFVFVLLIFFCALYFMKVNVLGVITVLVIYLIIFLTFILGHIFVYEFDYGYTIGILKAFSPLIFLFWINKIRLIEKLIFPSVIVSLILLSSVLIFLFNKILFDFVYQFYMSHDATVMIGKRVFLGIEMMSFFYKSLPVLIIPASIYSYRLFFNSEKKVKSFLLMALFLFALLLGGTRAGILAAFIVFTINPLLWLFRSNFWKVLVIPSLIFFALVLSLFVFKFLAEKNELSNKIKFRHLDSYSELVIDNPSIIIFGQGAGSLFFSKGKDKLVATTEWSYIEFFRMFGVFGVIIVTLFFHPLYLVYIKRKKLKEWLPIFNGYLLYLIVGGTNPLLLGSTGMLVLLVVYSYALNPYYENNKW